MHFEAHLLAKANQPNSNPVSYLQCTQIFVWVDKLTDDRLMLSPSLQAQPEKALYFARDSERLILADNIQVMH